MGELRQRGFAPMKKLLILVNTLANGGAEHVIYELVKHLDYQRYKPEVLCYASDTKSHVSRQVREICPVTFLGLDGTITGRTIRKVLRTISRIRPDIIHAHQGGTLFALLWCLIHRKPLCITVHARPDIAFNPKTKRLLKLLLPFLRVHLVACSETNLELVRQYYHVPPEKCAFVNNGIELGRFTQMPHRQFTFLNVARQDENKNQAAILRCFAAICMEEAQPRLILVGDGPCHEQLAEQCCALQVEDRVLFTGAVDDPAPYYAQSDVYVMASHREAMPLTVLEAMAAGLPIISTDVGGLRDVVNQNGILLKDGDEIGFANAMHDMMQLRKEERSAMASTAKDTLGQFASQKMAESYMEIYDRLIERKK